MKQTAKPDAIQAAKAVGAARPAQATVTPSGPLVQTAAMMNGSSRMQDLAQLRIATQQSPRVQALMSLASEINQGSPAQLRGVEGDDDAILENKVESVPDSSGSVAQLYSEVSEANIQGYGKGIGANAPNFEFQEVSASKTVNQAASTIDYGVDANQVFEASPILRVSDDGFLAVPTRNKSDAKVFFATAAKITESNTLLHDAGAPLRLTQGAGHVQLTDNTGPFGPNLNEVTPDLTNVVNQSSECGDFAAAILGTPVITRKPLAPWGQRYRRLGWAA